MTLNSLYVKLWLSFDEIRPQSVTLGLQSAWRIPPPPSVPLPRQRFGWLRSNGGAISKASLCIRDIKLAKAEVLPHLKSCQLGLAEKDLEAEVC